MKYSDDDNMVQADEFLDQKKTTGAVHIISLLICIILLAVGGYFLYTKIIEPKIEEAKKVALAEKKKEEEEEKVSKVKSLDIDSDLVVRLVSYIDRGFLNNEKVEVTDISNQVLFVKAIPFALDLYGKNNITKEEFDKLIDEMYGKAYPFKHEKYSSKLCVRYIYDEDSGKYLYQDELYCGSSSVIPLGEDLIRAVRAEEEDGVITITIRVLFFKALEENGTYKAKYYADYEMKEEVTDLNVSGEYALASNTTDNLSKGAMYKLTFTKEDDNYVFTSSEFVSE